jgi:hypothetical protein
MKYFLLTSLFFSNLQLAIADEQTISQASAIAYLNESCTRNIGSMLIGFSSPNKPLTEDVSKVCGCMEDSLQGKSWESKNKLDQALVSSAHNCAKPIAHEYSKQAIKLRMNTYFAAQKWSPPQVQKYLDCFADGIWKSSVERAQEITIESLLKNCEAEANQ